jgi:hypothetical protein
MVCHSYSKKNHLSHVRHVKNDYNNFNHNHDMFHDQSCKKNTKTHHMYDFMTKFTQSVQRLIIWGASKIKCTIQLSWQPKKSNFGIGFLNM